MSWSLVSQPFEDALAHTFGIEGGYSDDKNDSGGKTRYGITENVARAFGYRGEMCNLPRPLAEQIYRQNYWNVLQLDHVAELSPAISMELFDTAVNCGVGFAGRSLQRCLNALNREQRDYPDMTVDGVFGMVTRAAFRSYMETRGLDGETVMLRALNSLQGTFYLELAEARLKDEKFLFGWFLNRVDIPSRSSC